MAALTSFSWDGNADPGQSFNFLRLNFDESIAHTLSASEVTVVGDAILSPTNSILLSGSSALFLNFTLNDQTTGTFTVAIAANAFSPALGDDIFLEVSWDASNSVTVVEGVVGIPVALTASTTSTYPNQTVTITATFDQSVTGLLLSDFSTSAGTLSNLQGSGTTWTVDLALPATGTGTATVTLAADSVTVGGLGNVEGTVGVSYAPQAPTLTSAASSGFNGQDVELTITFPATPTGFAIGDLSTTGGTLSNLTVDPNDNKIYTADLTLPTSGTSSVTVTLAANSVQPPNTAATATISHEPLSAITITPSETSGYNSDVVRFTALFPVSVSNFVIGDLETTNGTLSNLQGSGVSWTFDLTLPATGTGTAVVSLPAGSVTPLNALATAAAVSYGPITPVITRSASAGYNGQVIGMEIDFPVAPTGFAIGDLSTTAGTLGNLQGSGTAWTFDLTLPTSGTGTATVSITAGSVTPNNVAASAQVQHEPITATITASVARVLIGTNFTFNVQLNYAVTGIDTADFSVDNGTIEGVTGSGDYWEVEVTAPATGAGTITITMRANAAAEGSASATGSTEWISEDPNAPVIAQVAEQNILIDTPYQLRVGITNDPEDAYAFGDLEGYGAYWDATENELVVEGHPEEPVSGKRYTIHAVKGEFQREREVIYNVIPAAPVIESFGPFTAYKGYGFRVQINIQNNPSTVIARGPWLFLKSEKNEEGVLISGDVPDRNFRVDSENIVVLASNSAAEVTEQGIVNLSSGTPPAMSVTSEVDINSIRFSWSLVPNALSYAYRYKLTSAMNYGEWESLGNVSEVNVEELERGTSYDFQFRVDSPWIGDSVNITETPDVEIALDTFVPPNVPSATRGYIGVTASFNGDTLYLMESRDTPNTRTHLTQYSLVNFTPTGSPTRAAVTSLASGGALGISGIAYRSSSLMYIHQSGGLRSVSPNGGASSLVFNFPVDNTYVEVAVAYDAGIWSTGHAGSGTEVAEVYNNNGVELRDFSIAGYGSVVGIDLNGGVLYVLFSDGEIHAWNTVNGTKRDEVYDTELTLHSSGQAGDLCVLDDALNLYMFIVSGGFNITKLTISKT